MDIEKALLPDCGELVIKKDGFAYAQIFDAELDIVDCSFENDNCVRIDTKNLQWIYLDQEHLYLLAHLIEEAQEYYETQSEKWKNEPLDWD